LGLTGSRVLLPIWATRFLTQPLPTSSNNTASIRLRNESAKPHGTLSSTSKYIDPNEPLTVGLQELVLENRDEVIGIVDGTENPRGNSNPS